MIILYCLILFIIFILGIAPMLNNRKSISNIVHFFSSMFISVWVLGNLMMYNTTEFLFWNRVAYFGASWVAYFILLFVLIYPKPMIKFTFIRLLIFTAIPLLISISSFSEFIVKDMKSISEITFGPGNAIWGVYFLLYVIVAFVFATKGLKSNNQKQKRQVQYMLWGLYLFFFFALTTNLVLPAFGSTELYKMGPLFSVLYVGFTGYSILKHQLMNITLIVRNSAAYSFLILIVISSIILIRFVLDSSFPYLNKELVLSGIAVFWALLGYHLKESIITGARHAFVKGYYNQDKLFSDLATRIKDISDKEKIFQIIEKTFDKWIKFEKTAIIIPARNIDENVTHYLLRYQLLDTEVHNIKLELSDPILEVFNQKQDPTRILELEPEVRNLYEKIGFDPKTIFIPFRSIEAVEGILVLGERSGGYPLKNEDFDFFKTIITLINSILFGLTPLEQIENRYMKNQQKVHDAEVQMLRSEKNEDIGFHHIQMAHEIRSAASIIKMATEDLPEDPEYEENKKAILRANENSIFIASRTLELQQQKADVSSMVPVDTNEILRESAEIVDPKKYKLVRDFQELPATIGDPGELQIAFTNLINNAMQAMDEGGSITLKSAVKGPNITIEFTDTGKGISDEQKAKIWQPYIAGEQTEGQGNVRHSGGRGWGLTIINKIITDHSGAIRLESKVGEGTTFYVRLPIKDTAGMAPAAKVERPTASSDTTSPTESESAPPAGLMKEETPAPAGLMKDDETPPAGLVQETPASLTNSDEPEAPAGLIKE